MSFQTQISNRNFLSPGGFRFTLAKYPKVSYLTQMANIPNISLSLVEQPTPYRDTYIEGTLDYGRFNLQFLVDEDMENYLILHNWMRGLGVPETFGERQEFIDSNESINTAKALGEDLIFADGTLMSWILISNQYTMFSSRTWNL